MLQSKSQPDVPTVGAEESLMRCDVTVEGEERLLGKATGRVIRLQPVWQGGKTSCY